MSEWWSGLGFEAQVYYTIAIVATSVLFLQMLLMMVGIGADELADAGDVDMDGPEDHPSGIHLLSSRTLVAFAMGFGWAGAMRAVDGAGAAVTVLIAGLVGLLFAYAVLRLMQFLATLRHSGTLNYDNAIGEIGSVYLEVHPAMAAGGQIQVTVQGRLRVVQTLTRSDRPIEKGARVRVTERLGPNTLIVESLTGQDASKEG